MKISHRQRKRERRANLSFEPSSFTPCRTEKRDRASVVLRRLGKDDAIEHYRLAVRRLTLKITLLTAVKRTICKPSLHPDWYNYWYREAPISPELKALFVKFNEVNQSLMQAKCKLERNKRFLNNLLQVNDA